MGREQVKDGYRGEYFNAAGRIHCSTLGLDERLWWMRRWKDD